MGGSSNRTDTRQVGLKAVARYININTMDDEEWKEVLNNPNYEVSSFGNVRSKARGNVKIDKKRYSYACIYYGGKMKRCLVHRLVAEVFLDNPENKMTIDHINRNKHDNTITNLRWATQQENLWNKAHKGYSKRPNGRFEVKIRDNSGKRIYLGTYDTEEEAHQVYRDKAEALRKNILPNTYEILGK